VSDVRSAIGVAITLALAACQERNVTQAPEPILAPTRATAAEPARHMPGKAILDAGGVALGRTAATATRFAFGASRSEIEAAARALAVDPERSTLDECGAGPMAFTEYGGLKLNFQDDKLVGWFTEADPSAVTSDGIRPGIFLRDLAVTRSAQFIEGSTLEGEFKYIAADGERIGGFASGEGRDARIESLYAGVNCFFR
jgi:hypothetical protein